jgi:hypothetical protein
VSGLTLSSGGSGLRITRPSLSFFEAIVTKLPTVQRQGNMDSGAENGRISTPVPKPAQF